MKKKIIGTQIVVILIIFIGKFIGFLRESILAAKFGTSYQMDIYSFSMTMLLFLSTIGYSITTTVIPIFTKNKNKTKKEQEDLANNLINIMFIMGLIVNLITIIFSKSIIKIFAPGFSGESLNLAKNLVIIMNFSLISIFIQSVISGILQAYNMFFASAAMATIGNIITIIYLIFFIDKYGIYGFGIAIIISYFAQLLINLPSYKKLDFKYSFKLNIKDKEIIKIFKLTIPILISTCIIQLLSIITTFFGSLIGEGAISIFNYSNRLVNLTVEIFAIGMSMVIYPMLSNINIKFEYKEFNRILNRAILTMLFVILPITVLIIILNKEIIIFIYERNEFTRESTTLTAKMLLILSPIIVFSSLRDLLNKVSYSLGEAKLTMKISIIMVIVSVISNLIFYKRGGIYTLASTTTLINIIGTIYTFKFIKSKYENIKIYIKGYIEKIIFSCISMGAISFLFKNMILNKINNIFFTIIFTGIIGVIVYILSITLLFIKDILQYKRGEY